MISFSVIIGIYSLQGERSEFNHDHNKRKNSLEIRAASR